MQENNEKFPPNLKEAARIEPRQPVSFLNPEFFDNDKYLDEFLKVFPGKIELLKKAVFNCLEVCSYQSDCYPGLIFPCSDDLREGLTNEILNEFKDLPKAEFESKKIFIRANCLSFIIESYASKSKLLHLTGNHEKDKFFSMFEFNCKENKQMNRVRQNNLNEDLLDFPVISNHSSFMFNLLKVLLLTGGAVAIVAGLAVMLALNLILVGAVTASVGLISSAVGIGLFAFSRPSYVPVADNKKAHDLNDKKVNCDEDEAIFANELRA